MSHTAGTTRVRHRSETFYDADGRVSHSTDQFLLRVDAANGTESIVTTTVTGTHTVYDEVGRTVKTEGLEGLVIDIQGGTGGPFTSVLTSSGTVVWQSESVYDEKGQLETSIGRHASGVEGPRTDFFYDAFGRQEATLGPALPVTSGDFDDFTLPQGTTQVRHRSETAYDEVEVVLRKLPASRYELEWVSGPAAE